MGDRWNSTHFTRLTTTWDDKMGAGRLHARTFDSIGLDDPARAIITTVCVKQGFNVVISIPFVSTDVDGILAVAYWYDKRHGTNGIHDKIDMRLYKNDVVVQSATTNDNKQRIFYDDPDASMALELRGRDVTSDIAGCGDNSMRVNLAYYMEDFDRESGEGLTDVQTM